jgi:hypothetical protein
MTTIPTVSPKLPDLDRLEALAKQAGLNGWPFHGVAFQKAANPSAVLTLIALARRAQPEGEAPQADAERYRYLATLQDWSEIERLCRSSTASSAAQYKRDLDKLIDERRPAAQHAESGAQAGGDERREYTEAVAREAWAVVCNNSKGMPDDMQAAIRDALLAPFYSHAPAAQHADALEAAHLAHIATLQELAELREQHAESGALAPGVVLPYGDALDTIAASAAREVDGIFTDAIPIKSLVVYARAVARLALAAQSQGAQGAMRECPECDGTGRVSGVELCARCNQSGILPAAQEAAAPGALDELAALRRLIECAEILDKRPRPMCRDCADEAGACPNSGLECDMCALLAKNKALYNRLAAPSAPGTPEAPAEFMPFGRFHSRKHADGSVTTFHTRDDDPDSFVLYKHAAQLDGGQGEEA